MFAISAGYAQQTPRGNPSDIPSSRDPKVKEAEKKPEQKRVSRKKNKKGKSEITIYYDVKVQEFYKRMKANAKKYKKMQREMKKPQYSDPMYFGHKKMPKKRPPGKKKYCRECGIVH
jgi:archaellum component FlaD/FlaE